MTLTPRLVARRAARRRADVSETLLDPASIRGPVVVLSPHQDDETLACGGTVRLLRDLGTPVSIVFLMDGTRSHQPMIPGSELSAIRHAEALSAAARLGVGADDVEFLDLPEGKLLRSRDEGVERLTHVFERRQPEEIFVPSALEPKKDHAATHEVACAAVASIGRSVTFNEYPVWCWYHWPAVPFPLTPRSVHPPMKPRQELPRVVEITRLMDWGARIFREFTTRVDIRTVLDAKREALDEYTSQMTRLRPDPKWATLGDVGNGAFLDVFLDGDERFRRHRSFPSEPHRLTAH